jgi:hypothetical protein
MDFSLGFMSRMFEFAEIGYYERFFRSERGLDYELLFDLYLPLS